MARDKFIAKPEDEQLTFTWNLGILTLNKRFLDSCSANKRSQILNLIKRAQTAPAFRRAR